VTLTRDVPSSEPAPVPVTVVPEDVSPWSEPPRFRESAVSIPSLGLAYQIVPSVFSVDRDGPAAKAGIQKLDTVVKVTLSRAADVKFDGFPEEKDADIEVGETGWAYAYWVMQNEARSRNITLTIKPASDSSTPKDVEITPT